MSSRKEEKEQRDISRLRKTITDMLTIVLQIKTEGIKRDVPVKRCCECRKYQPLDEFGLDKSRRSGKNPSCKSCIRSRSRVQVAKIQSDPILREIKNERRQRWRQKNPGRELSTRKAYLEKHPEILRSIRAKENKRQKEKQYWKRLTPEQKKRFNETAARYKSTRRKNDQKYRLRTLITGVIWRSLKNGKGGCSWESLVGYSLSDLMAHLEKQFTLGMTWDNRGHTGWHIDHIIPISAFNFTSPQDLDFKRCWALENLQPLWAVDNMKKQGKLAEPFQPSLALQIKKAPGV